VTSAPVETGCLESHQMKLQIKIKCILSSLFTVLEFRGNQKFNLKFREIQEILLQGWLDMEAEQGYT